MKPLRRNLFILLTIAFLVMIFSAPALAAPSVDAAAAVVMDCDTGAFYYTKDADTMRVPASMTKLMTAYIIFEELNKGTFSKNSVVTVSAAAARVAATGGYSNVPLSQGEKYTVDTMVKLMLIPSACGACHAMAEYISGSEAAFVARMNSTAAALGMKANFTNCHGAINHYVTARSMALLAYHFINNYPDIVNYTSLQAISFKGTTYRNTNRFLSSDYYAGVDGLKTGTSSAAGSCMTVTAKQNNRRIITVVMRSGNRYGDTRALLNYGFSSVQNSDAAAASASLALSSEIPAIRRGADFTVSAAVAQTSVPFMASGGWQVNAATVATFDSRPLEQGTVLTQKLNLDGETGSDVTVTFYLNLPTGGTKTVSVVFPFSDEIPCAFRDINRHWAEDVITQLKDLGALNGYADHTFRPDKTITRAEFVTALIRVMTAKELLEITDAQGTFHDVLGTWSEPYVALAAANRIIDGYPDGSFRPDQNITRQEVAVVISRAFQMEETDQKETAFRDNDAIASWAKAAVAAATANGVISGYGDHSFRPANNATRGESAALLMRSAALLDGDGH